MGQYQLQLFFTSSLMFEGYARSLPKSRTPEKCFTLVGRLGPNSKH